MRKTAIIMLLLSGAALANDGIVFFAESVELVENDKTNVAMREEEIIITLHRDYYEVDVSLKFYNDGPDEKLLVGFPVAMSGSGVTGERIEKAKKAVLKSYINGKLLSPAEYKIKEEYRRSNYGDWVVGYTRWLLREIVFKSNSYTESRVVYKVPYSYEGYSFAGYTYGTGRSWKGPIGKMTVIVNNSDDVLVDGIFLDNFVTHSYDRDKILKPTWEASGKYKYVLENVNPERKNDMIIVPVNLFYDGIYGEYKGQFGCTEEGLFRCRFDCFYTCEGEEGRDWLGESWHWHRALIYKDPSEIRLFTKNQVRLFINFFFAIHGYDFKNKLYKDYFQKRMKKTDWDRFEYKVNPNFSEKDFNDIERKNIDYLLKLEKMIPNKTGEEKPK